MAAKQKGIMVNAQIVPPSVPNFVTINVLGVESKVGVKELNADGIDAIISVWSDAFRAHCQRMRDMPMDAREVSRD